MKFLLDTNVLSEAIKKDPSKSVLAMMKKHEAQIATAAPVWHELKFGSLRLPDSKKKTLIETFLYDVVLSNIPVLSYDQKAAEWHAQERSRLVSSGKIPSFVDGQIAGIASVNGLTLVSRNVKDFKPFKGLKIVNWHKK